MKSSNSFKPTAIALAVLSAYGTAAFAEDDEISQYITPESSVSLGIGSWTNERLHEGVYDGMRDKGSYGSVDADIRKRNDATGVWTNLTVRNLGMDNVEANGTYEKQGDWGVGVDYSQIPRYNQVIVNTGLQGIGTQTQTITAVTPGAGSDRRLEMRRDATSVSLFKIFSKSLEMRVNFKNEEKNGDRQWGVRNYPTLGATSGSYPAFIAEPIDSTIRQLDLTLSYSGKKLRLTGGYYGSWYDNRNTRIDVIGTAAGVTEMSLPPDNQAHQGYLQGNYDFTPTTRGMFKVAYTHATQNDSFISTSNNGVAAWTPLTTAGSSLEGKVDTTEVMAGVTARPMTKLSLVAKLSYWDRQDKTPFRTNGQNTAGTVFYHNNPFSNTKTSGVLEGTYRLQGGFSVVGGVDYTNVKREFDHSIDTEAEFFSPYRTKLKETTYRLGARRSLSEFLNGSATYSHSKRTGSSYLPAEAAFDNITPIHVADRDRDRVKLAIDWNPTSSLGVQFAFADSQDKYPAEAGHTNGVRNGKAQLWSVDAMYAITDDWGVNAWYSHDNNKIRQTGIRSSVEWVGDIEDKADTFGFGAKGKVSEKLDIGLNFDWTRSHTDYRQATTVALTGGVALPSIENRISRANIFGNYSISKRSSLRVDLIREIWKTDDWTWAFSDGTSFSYATEGTQIVNPLDQSGTFFGARYSYKF